MKGQHESPAVSALDPPAADLLHKFSRWYELHKERELLASLSDEALNDIG
jgi:uncharacterized protein YjiS (DUF1127 family)